jgi:hypothetical protein
MLEAYVLAGGPTVRDTRRAGVKDSFTGKTRRNNQSLRRGGALAALPRRRGNNAELLQ